MKTELSSTGPAIPIAAISGYLLRGMSDKNYRKAFSKVSWDFTKTFARFTTYIGSSEGGYIKTNYSLILVPPISPSNE